MNLQTGRTAAPRSFVALDGNYAPSGIQSVVLRRLRTEREIASILHLRDEIDLSAHLGAAQDFRALEKKETN